MGFATTSKYGSRRIKNLIMNGEQTHGRVAEYARGPESTRQIGAGMNDAAARIDRLQ